MALRARVAWHVPLLVSYSARATFESLRLFLEIGNRGVRNVGRCNETRNSGWCWRIRGIKRAAGC